MTGLQRLRKSENDEENPNAGTEKLLNLLKAVRAMGGDQPAEILASLTTRGRPAHKGASSVDLRR